MAAPTITYSIINGQRVATVNGVKLNSNRTVVPAGSKDIKTNPAGTKLLSMGGNLHEPLDVAEMLNKI